MENGFYAKDVYTCFSMYAIYFAYRYFLRFWTRLANLRGLNSRFNSHVLKLKFSRGLTREIRENKNHRKNNHVYSIIGGGGGGCIAK